MRNLNDYKRMCLKVTIRMLSGKMKLSRHDNLIKFISTMINAMEKNQESLNI